MAMGYHKHSGEESAGLAWTGQRLLSNVYTSEGGGRGTHAYRQPEKALAEPQAAQPGIPPVLTLSSPSDGASTTLETWHRARTHPFIIVRPSCP